MMLRNMLVAPLFAAAASALAINTTSPFLPAVAAAAEAAPVLPREGHADVMHVRTAPVVDTLRKKADGSPMEFVHPIAARTYPAYPTPSPSYSPSPSPSPSSGSSDDGDSDSDETVEPEEATEETSSSDSDSDSDSGFSQDSEPVVEEGGAVVLTRSSSLAGALVAAAALFTWL